MSEPRRARPRKAPAPAPVVDGPIDLSFIAFLARLGRTPTAAQRVWLSVAIDGVEPSSLALEEQALAFELFGTLVVPACARHVVALLKGARVGGTWLCSLALLHAALTFSADGLAAGERPVCPIVAPDLRLARQALRYITGEVDAHPELLALVLERSCDSISLRRDDGTVVDIVALPAKRGGSATRGRTVWRALMDESSFFFDVETGVVNDSEIYRALVARVVLGGALFVISTAWMESGLLWDFIQANHGAPTTALAAIAPTLLMRPTNARLAAVVAAERVRDAQNAAREFNCEHFATGSEMLFDSVSIAAASEAAAVDSSRAAYGCGVDFAFRSDASALCIVVAHEGNFELVEWREMRPERSKPLVPSEVCSAFAGVASAHGCRTVASDGHYLESVREHMREHEIEIVDAPAGQEGKAESYMAVRDLLREQRLRIPSNAEHMLAQLKTIVARPTPGGGMSVSAKRRKGGGHSDLVSAMVLAVWAAKNRPKFWCHSPGGGPDAIGHGFGDVRGYG